MLLTLEQARALSPVPVVWTWGHGTKDVGQSVAELSYFGITHAADVRSSPTSGRNPQHMGYNQNLWMEKAGIARSLHKYTLGGHRKCRREIRDAAWREDGFRRYAPWMRDPRFLRGLLALASIAAQEPTAFYCAETYWGSCHRKMIADYFMLVLRWPVRHIRSVGEWEFHKPIPETVREGDKLYYDGNQLRFPGL